MEDDADVWKHVGVLTVYKILYTEWPKEMYTLFTHQYLWNKFK